MRESIPPSGSRVDQRQVDTGKAPSLVLTGLRVSKVGTAAASTAGWDWARSWRQKSSCTQLLLTSFQRWTKGQCEMYPEGSIMGHRSSQELGLISLRREVQTEALEGGIMAENSFHKGHQ